MILLLLYGITHTHTHTDYEARWGVSPEPTTTVAQPNLLCGETRATHTDTELAP